MTLTGQVALVTGASRGIGRAVALELAHRGADLAVHFHQQAAAAENVCAEIRALGRRAIAVQADLARRTLPEGFAARISAELGDVSLLVCNAGMQLVEPSAFMDLDDWDQLLATNLRGALVVVQAFLPRMLKARAGSVVLVSSAAGEHGFAGMGAYSASKGGLDAFGKALALESATRGVRVNVVAPGIIDTEMSAPHLVTALKPLVDRTPLGRAGSAEDVAKAVAFLLSADAGFITGQVLSVNGGLFT